MCLELHDKRDIQTPSFYWSGDQLFQGRIHTGRPFIPVAAQAEGDDRWHTH
jgi:hypothetical protein